MSAVSSRRGFLGAAGVALTGAAFPSAALAAGREVPLLDTYVAGTERYAARRLLAHLHVGDPVSLLREPDNSYDRRAVSVWTPTGEKLGYLPRIDVKAVANLLDEGFAPVSRITVIRAGARPDIRLDIGLPLA